MSVFADEKSEALLTALAQKMASWRDYRVEFSVTIADQTLAGSYEVSGQKYRVLTPEIVLYCDGATKWEVNLLDREVAVDRVDPGDRTVMGNPTRLFDFLDGSYSHRYVGVALIGGTPCERIELIESALSTTNGAGAGAGAGTGTGARTGTGTRAGTGAESGLGTGAPQTLEVYLSTATGLPVRVGYTIGLLGSEAAIDVLGITPGITLGAEFSYDPARYRGFETIDFR